MIRGLKAIAWTGLFLTSQPALAATQIFNLSVADPAAGLGTGPFGTVQVTENLDHTLTFVETLSTGYRIHLGNTNHNAFAFKVNSDPTVTVSGLTAGFSAIALTGGSNETEPPFGTFFTAHVCSSCGPGYSGGNAGPVTFTLGAANGLTLASLGYNLYNNQKIFFTSDVVNQDGFTGNVGAVIGDVSAVPEPNTWAMMLIGFGFAGYSLRRRKGVAFQVA